VSVDFLYGASEWLIGLLFLMSMLAADELGFHLGRKAEPRTDEKTKSQISVVQGAMLGVLGLLLGFTTAMAVSRFDTRKQLVLDEANAIGTSYLRTQLLPTPEGTEIANLLREYVDVRLQYSGAGVDLEHLKAAKERAEQLQTEFWSRAVVFAQKDSRSVTAGLLLQSLNQVIDLEAARWTAFVHHVPETVIYVDGIVALLAAILVGYGYGLGGRRHVFSMFILAFSITAVLAVIVDLDRPRQGFIRVSQQPMIDLQHQLAVPKL
jgi:hypothetical protein